MRWTAWACLVICGLLLAGCGSSDAPTTAGAGGSSPPPPPGSSGPPAPGDAGGGTPAEGAPADGGQAPGGQAPGGQAPGAEGGTQTPAASDSPPGALPAPGSPNGLPNPGSPDAAQPPPEGANPDGGQPGETNPDGTPRRPARPQTLREQSIAAFRGGSDADGLKLLHAHFAFVPDAKQELSQKMAWIPALARPALGPRIGVAVHYVEAPRDFRASPMPIGSPALTTAVESWQQSEAGDRGIGGNRRASRIGGGGGGGAGGGGGGGGSETREGAKGDSMRNAAGPAQLNYYTGQFGEMFLDALEERLETGEYGAALQDVFREAARGRRARGNSNDPNGQLGGTVSSDGGAADSPDGGTRRGGGSALDGVDGAEGGGRARRWTSGAAAQEAASLQQVKQLSPCILWLGKEEVREEIIKRAEIAAVDVLAIFEMTVREARTGGFVNNTTKLRLLITKGNKPVPGYTPEPLVNMTVEQWRQKEEKGIDPVEREVTKAVESLDKVLKPMPLPEALTAERAKKRIADLVAEKPADPLAVIVEARFYVAKGLLAEEDFTSAAVNLLGQNGFTQLQAKAKIGTE